MYPDWVYQRIGVTGISWAGIALLFALFVYAFDFSLCYLTGGIDAVHRLRKAARQGKPARRMIFLSADERRGFKLGASQRVNELIADRITIIWPLTVVALPIVIYGMGWTLIDRSIQSLSAIQIDLMAYPHLPGGQYLQGLIWLFSILYSIRNFLRYQRERTSKTVQAQSLTFHILRTILIILPITYVITSVVVLWAEFSLPLYFMLLDPTIAYTVLHPDMMYGLRTVYETLLFMGSSLVVASFLPIVVWAHERGQKYQAIYTLGMTAALLGVLISAGLPIYRFSERLGKIHEQALQAALQDNEFRLPALPGQQDTSQYETSLSHVDFVAKLPDKFIFPPFLAALVSLRSIEYLYNLFRTPNLKRKGNHPRNRRNERTSGRRKLRPERDPHQPDERS